MRKSVHLLTVAALLSALAGCEKSGSEGPGGKYVTVTFEDTVLFGVTGDQEYRNILWGIELAEDAGGYMGNVFDGILYSEHGVSFGSYYTDMGGYWETWGGFAISSNRDLVTEGTDNQFSAYASRVSKFAVAYNLRAGGMPMGAEYDRPVMLLDTPKSIVSALFANNAWTYLHCEGGQMDEDGYYTVTVTGFNGDLETGSVEVEMIRGGAAVITDWTTVNLTPLGEVDRIEFGATASDTMVPFYFCIDDIRFKVE